MDTVLKSLLLPFPTYRGKSKASSILQLVPKRHVVMVASAGHACSRPRLLAHDWACLRPVQTPTDPAELGASFLGRRKFLFSLTSTPQPRPSRPCRRVCAGPPHHEAGRRAAPLPALPSNCTPLRLSTRALSRASAQSGCLHPVPGVSTLQKSHELSPLASKERQRPWNVSPPNPFAARLRGEETQVRFATSRTS